MLVLNATRVQTGEPIVIAPCGNVQRALLARRLTGEVDPMIVCNPCFRLDFSAVAEIRSRIMQARNNGAAVLLMRKIWTNFWRRPTAFW
jgi:general nucleoside transport system ATP-binding protein